jgi:hypothetical protein
LSYILFDIFSISSLKVSKILWATTSHMKTLHQLWTTKGLLKIWRVGGVRSSQVKDKKTDNAMGIMKAKANQHSPADYLLKACYVLSCEWTPTKFTLGFILLRRKMVTTSFRNRICM